MGNLLPNYKKSIIDEIVYSISSNTSQYYMFASNPIPYSGNTPPVNQDDYSNLFVNDWQMLFGKRISNTDIVPIIINNVWNANLVYSSYDNNTNNMFDSYVVTQPDIVGGSYNIYKCIDNANGSLSTAIPDQIQPTSFQKSDGYIWRYLTSISSSVYNKFATSAYIPLVVNSAIVASAYNYSGVEVIKIRDGGQGYSSYHDGVVRSVVNNSLIQIEPTASIDNDFYTKNSIYIYNNALATSQLKTVSKYVSNSSGNWIYLDSSANTTNIIPTVTQYKISPRVLINSDGDTPPIAYSVVNTFSNSISNIVIIDVGNGISRANTSIVSNTIYGVGANVYCVVPPPGGHCSNPISELGVKGYCIATTFANSEGNALPTNITYNKIGLIKNINSLQANNTKGSRYSTNTFNQVLVANVSPSTTYTVGDIVTGLTSNAIGTVAFSNSSVVYLTGDKKFISGEYLNSSDNTKSAIININRIGDIYTKDLFPLYVQNIDNVTRSASQNESFKIIIQV